MLCIVFTYFSAYLTNIRVQFSHILMIHLWQNEKKSEQFELRGMIEKKQQNKMQTFLTSLLCIFLLIKNVCYIIFFWRSSFKL